MKKKSDLIREIVRLTGLSDDESFDKLADQSEKYLIKLLKVIKGL